MASLFPFAAAAATRVPPKRKMSGPAVALARDLTRSTASSTSGSWLCALCRSVDGREVLAFVGWKLLILLVAVLAVADWVFFFKFVVAPEQPPRARLQYGTLWAALTLALVHLRSTARVKCGADVRTLADHLEIFIAVSLAMVFSTNVAFFLHAPADVPLRDLGFLLLPEQALDSPWRPLSDILTAVVPVLGLLQTLLMTRTNRCRVIATFFRVASVSYALRMLTVSLTSLPGPAPHCRLGSALYAPPQNWVDIVTRVGPMYGQFHSCGDLIFSGHMAYTNSALLLYLRTMDRHCARYSRLRWLAGGGFVLTLAGLCVAGRKHYTVDVVLGVVVSSLVYFHFEYSWVPTCAHHSQETSQQLLGSHHQQVAKRTLSSPFGFRSASYRSAKVSDFEVYDDDDGESLDHQQQPQPQDEESEQFFGFSPMDFIC